MACPSGWPHARQPLLNGGSAGGEVDAAAQAVRISKQACALWPRFVECLPLVRTSIMLLACCLTASRARFEPRGLQMSSPERSGNEQEAKPSHLQLPQVLRTLKVA